MTKRLKAKHKIERRLGVNLWGENKSPYDSRPYAPGVHGRRRRKISDFGLQLRAKQMLKGYYGNISEKKFRRYYKEAVRMRGDSGNNLISLLERRLDSVIFHGKFVPTMFSARQIINHGHITVNGKRVNIASYLLKSGDVIQLKAKSRTLPLVIQAQDNSTRTMPDYITFDDKQFTLTFTHYPEREEVPYPVQMEPSVVVAFYSR